MTWPPLLHACTAARMLSASSVLRSLWDSATHVLLRFGEDWAWKGRGVRRVSRKFSATDTDDAAGASSKRAARDDAVKGSIVKDYGKVCPTFFFTIVATFKCLKYLILAVNESRSISNRTLSSVEPSLAIATRA